MPKSRIRVMTHFLVEMRHTRRAHTLPASFGRGRRSGLRAQWSSKVTKFNGQDGHESGNAYPLVAPLCACPLSHRCAPLACHRLSLRGFCGRTQRPPQVTSVPRAPDGSGGRNRFASRRGASSRSNHGDGDDGSDDDSDDKSGRRVAGGGDGGGLVTTGQLGEVMGESCRIAYTLARNFLNTRVVRNPNCAS